MTRRPPPPLTPKERRRLLIQVHRARLEAEVRALRLGVLPDEDVRRVFEFDEGTER